MAILGYEGRVSLLREAPDPLLFGSSALHARTNSIQSTSNQFWSGDEVTLFCEDGLPTDRNAPGMAQYGESNTWLVGITREHIIEDSDRFYRADDSVLFYEQYDNAPVQRRVFIHVDQLGRLSFYLSQSDAMVGRPEQRLPLGAFDWGTLLLYAKGTMDYDNAVLGRYGTYDWVDFGGGVIGEKTLGCPCDCAPNWEFVCDLTSWDLETDAAAVDTTPIGVKFGEGIKALVRASGTFDFFVDSKDSDWDGQRLLQLVLLLERGCKAHAQFWMLLNRAGGGCEGLLPGDLYYDTDILLVRSVVSVRVDGLITGSASFSTTEDVALRVGT